MWVLVSTFKLMILINCIFLFGTQMVLNLKGEIKLKAKH